MTDKELMKKLVVELNIASSKYYNGEESPLSDKEFDDKINQLKELEQKVRFIYCNSPTINVGAPVLNSINQIEIKDKPMLSLDKVHSAKEIEKFSDGYDLIASVKCDGLSIRLIYENTDLVSANTRGNGYIGANITEHIKHFLNVPIKIKTPERFVIDGEAIIYNDDFAIVNKNGEFKNNRNTASGSLALLDTSIVKKRRLSFIAWDIIEGGDLNYYHYNLEKAEELGFTVVPAFALDCTKVEQEEIDEINKNLLKIAEEKGIPCDGIVWRINDIKAGEKKGKTAHHYLNAVAWKPEIKEYETTLKDIDYDVSRNGVLTPVAVYEPVEIEGSVCTRASLHNLSIMEELLGTPYFGQKIKISKANMIIPQVNSAEKRTEKEVLEAGGSLLNKDVVCPICGSYTKIITSDSGIKNLYCANNQCEGKLAQIIDHYAGAKGLDIKGLSRKTIEKLIDWNFINGIKDIYELNKYKIEWESKPGFGKASVGKILDAINAEGRHPKLESFISALGIPLIGKTIAKEIIKYYSTWEDFRNAVGGDWTQFEGFGPEISKAINNFDYSEADEIAAILDFKQPEVQNEVTPAAAIKDKIFCVTGKLTSGKFANRTELKMDIEANGGKLVGSISSKVNYLITNTPESGTQKNKDAKKLGIEIITEEDYLKMRS